MRQKRDVDKGSREGIRRRDLRAEYGVVELPPADDLDRLGSNGARRPRRFAASYQFILFRTVRKMAHLSSSQEYGWGL